MSFRQEHPIQFSSVCVICATIVVCVVALGFFSNRSQEIEAKKSVTETEITEAAHVEQTEERSQFWQKLVPWGSDEAEVADDTEAEAEETTEE